MWGHIGDWGDIGDPVTCLGLEGGHSGGSPSASDTLPPQPFLPPSEGARATHTHTPLHIPGTPRCRGLHPGVTLLAPAVPVLPTPGSPGALWDSAGSVPPVFPPAPGCWFIVTIQGQFSSNVGWVGSTAVVPCMARAALRPAAASPSIFICTRLPVCLGRMDVSICLSATATDGQGRADGHRGTGHRVLAPGAPGMALEAMQQVLAAMGWHWGACTITGCHVLALGAMEQALGTMHHNWVVWNGHWEQQPSTGCHTVGAGNHSPALGDTRWALGTVYQHWAHTGHAGDQGPSAGAVPVLDATLQGCAPLPEPVAPWGPWRQMVAAAWPGVWAGAPLGAGCGGGRRGHGGMNLFMLCAPAPRLCWLQPATAARTGLRSCLWPQSCQRCSGGRVRPQRGGPQPRPRLGVSEGSWYGEIESRLGEAMRDWGCPSRGRWHQLEPRVGSALDPPSPPRPRGCSHRG